MRSPPDDERVRARLVDGLAVGCVATLLMTGLAMTAPALAGPRLPLAAARALTGLRLHSWALALALALHLVYGTLAGALFTASARHISVGRGALYGCALWAVALTVYAPLVGLGFCAARQPGLAALALPPHLLYGLVLGALAPRGEIVQPLFDGDLDALT
jgi:hypothetical protein